MNGLIDFLRRLQDNNQREWFNAHKDEYLKALATFHTLVDELIGEIARFDSSVVGLTAKECTYRIYRDVRFSDDKRPYKTHMGAFICPGGKKSGYSGYYFHVSTGGDGYPDNHMLAVGDPRLSAFCARILLMGVVTLNRPCTMLMPAFGSTVKVRSNAIPKVFPRVRLMRNIFV